MFLFQTKYRNYLIITLVMLLAIPCSVKKEMKHRLQLETSQQSHTGNHKISCTNYSELKHSTQKVKIQEHILPLFAHSNPESASILADQTILPDFLSSQKEKIPSYLLFQRFLI